MSGFCFAFSPVLADSPPEAALTDLQIQGDVEGKLAEQDILKGNLRVEVEDGVAILSGMVPNIWTKELALGEVLDMQEVKAVEDDLTIATAESDEDLAKKISSQILRYSYYTVFDDINLGVHEGRVLLTGRVTMPFKAEEIVKRASKVLGVQELRNEIKTLPVSLHDSRLRTLIARKIYSNMLFVEYASRMNPPIHIIVERGKVTLTGAVRSEVEKRAAEHIARPTFGVFSLVNKLQVDS